MSSNITNIYATKGSVIYMTKKEKRETIEIDKELYLSMIQSPDSRKKNKAAELGLVNVWAYHCMRCNYVWFPRFLSDYLYIDYEELLFNEEPPKSCARCKTKYWNEVPRRETKKKKRVLLIKIKIIFIHSLVIMDAKLKFIGILQ